MKTRKQRSDKGLKRGPRGPRKPKDGTTQTTSPAKKYPKLTSDFDDPTLIKELETGRLEDVAKKLEDLLSYVQAELVLREKERLAAENKRQLPLPLDTK